MGKLVEFRKPRRLLGQRPVVGEGQVVMFTGVRYERVDAPATEKAAAAPDKPPTPARNKRKRG